MSMITVAKKSHAQVAEAVAAYLRSGKEIKLCPVRAGKRHFHGFTNSQTGTLNYRAPRGV